MALIHLGAVTALLVLLLGILFRPGPAPLPAPVPERDEAALKVCVALRSLQRLAPRGMGRAETPFQFLGLSPDEAPFKPPLSSRYLGHDVQAQIEDAVVAAGVRVRKTLWARLDVNQRDLNAEARITTSHLVSDMLTDEAARLLYLNTIHPKIGKWNKAVKAVNGICEGIIETGWGL
ncbi:hypothetical protein ColKHC_14268 [Colletotrichum higginsianum]|nr:hypothetical protein ColKHC_14268 [Colletotrichum higginsianum]